MIITMRLLHAYGPQTGLQGTTITDSLRVKRSQQQRTKRFLNGIFMVTRRYSRTL